MKFIGKLFLFVLFLLSTQSLLAGEMLTFLDGALSFQRPENVTLWEERPARSDPRHTNFWRGRIRLLVLIYDEVELGRGRFSEPFRDMRRTRGVSNLTRADFLGLFAANPEFVIASFLCRSSIRESYRRLMLNELTIGETYFHAGAKNLEASGHFGYVTYLIVKDRLVMIAVSLFTGMENNPLRNAEDFTIMRDGNLYWRNDASIIAFYEQLHSSRFREMPLILQQLREAQDLILQTLKVQDGAYKYNIRIVTP